jgi:stage V sporulation protein R
MMDEMANHGNRVRRYMDRFGVEVVEEFIDACLSIDDLIDIHSPAIERRDQPNRYDFANADEEEEDVTTARFRAKSYMDSFVNPAELLQREAERRREEKRNKEEHFPAHPERDVMLFLLQHAPLKPWQIDVLATLREEAYYFAPQGQTKIMNEGWASYWHSTIMTRQTVAPSEVICYCDHHSGTLATSPDRLNPYKLGIELFRDIEDRWNRGRFGKEYEECDDLVAKRDWDTGAGLGREKIFEVRRIHNDLTFIDTFLTLDFCREYKLFKFGYNPDSEYYEIESRAFPQVKQQLLANLTNMGRPMIAVRDGNYKNRGELFLEHTSTGVELKISEARDTLVNLHTLWNRPVHIETVLDGSITTLSYDGTEHTLEQGEEVPEVEDDA